MTWRARARTVIDRIAEANTDKTDREVLKLIDAAYPFGERKYHPYKAWLVARREWLNRNPRAGAEAIDRPCGACGAKAGHQCIDYEQASEGNYTRGPRMETFHEARIAPTSGPLFADATTPPTAKRSTGR